MTKLEDIVPRCRYKLQQEQGNQSYFIKCYDCNGFQERAKELQCPYFTLKKEIKIYQAKQQ